MKHPYAILSEDKYIQAPNTDPTPSSITKDKLSELYTRTKWRNANTTSTLSDILLKEQLIVIRTDNLVVLDFDDDLYFHKALDYNDTLSDTSQCKLIVRSLRKGGHFYFHINEDIPEPIGHTKQNIVDYLSGPKHNVIAPTKGDRGKTLHTNTNTDTLSAYSPAWDMFVQVIIAHNLPKQTLALLNYASKTHSDNNREFVKQYLSNNITNEEFDKFYNIPSPIPPQMSNEFYKNVSTRLACDDTISWEDYVQTMIKFNLSHKRKTPQELSTEVMDRMKPLSEKETSKNGLWKYNPNKTLGLFSLPHKRLKTSVSVFFDQRTNEYIVTYPQADSIPYLLVKRNRTAYIDYMEKIVTNPQKVRKTEGIPGVDVISDYSKSFGYQRETNEFNKAIVGKELKAFHGAKPYNYKPPTRLLEVCEFMWGEEYDYMLGSTKFRYTTFKFSPVVTFLQGTEGSGKDLSIYLLTKPFPGQSQQLSSQLLRDVHSNWQTEPNAIVSELGDWRAMDKEALLSTIKTISGSQGVVTYRGMQQTAVTVKSLIKIWVTGNTWEKLHTDPLSQRRIYPVYMPKPLSQVMGGPYSETELRDIFSDESILNFYYWLGNEYENEITLDQYISPVGRQQGDSYKLYLENTQNKSDVASEYIYSREWAEFSKAMGFYEVTLQDLVWKVSKLGNLVISTKSLKYAFRNGGVIIEKTIDRLVSTKEGNKRLLFERGVVEKYITIYNAPTELQQEMNITTL